MMSDVRDVMTDRDSVEHHSTSLPPCAIVKSAVGYSEIVLRMCHASPLALASQNSIPGRFKFVQKARVPMHFQCISAMFPESSQHGYDRHESDPIDRTNSVLSIVRFKGLLAS